MVEISVLTLKRCYECETQIPRDSVFCPICGQRHGHSKKDPHYWLKEATIQKKVDNLNAAIDCLKMAYKLADANNYLMPVKDRLRLPLYLQKANRKEESWREFNYLLVNCHRMSNGVPTSVLYLNYSFIYDKMRLFLEREGNQLESTKLRFTSEICKAISLAYSVITETHEDLKKFHQVRLNEFCASYFLIDYSPSESETVMQKYLRNLPNIDIGVFMDEINLALLAEKSSE